MKHGQSRATVTRSVTRPPERRFPDMSKSKRTPVILTDAKVRSLKADPGGEYVQGDLSLPGFGVRVRPTGAPSYVLMKRLPGETRPTRVTLGRIDTITLAKAREAARDAAVAVKQGVDV